MNRIQLFFAPFKTARLDIPPEDKATMKHNESDFIQLILHSHSWPAGAG